MGRGIKFRAWEETRKRMFMPNVIDLMIDFKGDIFSIDINKIEPITDLKLMQHTGLKDNLNKDLYEFDIVWCLSSDQKFIVEWDEIGTGYLFHNMKLEERTNGIDYYEFETMCENLGFEIIGNIYENPELLMS